MMFNFLKNQYDIESAFEVLEGIYSDRKVTLIGEYQDAYNFKVSLPDDLSWYVDPKIKEYSKAKILDMPISYKLQQNKNKVFLETYYHSNAIIAPTILKNTSGINIDCILHFDDHSDMMPLYKPLNFDEKAPLEKLVQLNVIGIGNFLTYYLTQINSIPTFHIQDKQSSSFEYINKKVKSLKQNHNIGDKVFEKVNFTYDKTGSSYIKTEIESLPHINYKNIWLDIDLDYFCNRYNRNSDWEESEYLNRNREEVKEVFRQFFTRLVNSSWLNKVRVVTIASSPGFFPLEYYDIAYELLILPLKERFLNDRF